MNLRRIKHTLLRLSAEEKVIGIGAIAIIIGTFMPWYQVVDSYNAKTEAISGLSGDLGVIGFVIFLMSIISAIVLVAENMHLPLPKFGYKREQILFFFLGQSAFLSLLTIAVYTKRSLEFTEAGLRFGIWIVLLGSFFGAMSAFALVQKTRKKEVVDFFQHDTENEPKTIEEMMEESHESSQAIDLMSEEAVSFAEDVTVMEEVQEALSSEQGVSDYIPEDEMIEDVQEVQKIDEAQGNHFMREAGVKKNESGDVIGGLSSNFYDDN